jgi:hypothetical protein
MSRIINFSAFDPVNGEPPAYNGVYFDKTVARARRILANRSRQDILSIGNLLSWIFKHKRFGEASLSALLKEAEALDNGSDSSPLNNFSEADNLKQSRQFINLDKQSFVNNASWPEIYATFSLLLTAEAAEWVDEYEQKNIPIENAIYPSTMASYLTEAIELVDWAEHEIEICNLDKIASDKRKNIAKTGAKKRHGPTNELLRELVEFYKKNRYTTYAATTQAFIESLPPDRNLPLVPTNMYRTLKEGLSEVIRGKRNI